VYLFVLSFFIRLCVSLLYRGRKCFKVIVSSRCNDPEINEAFFIEKKMY